MKEFFTNFYSSVCFIVNFSFLQFPEATGDSAIFRPVSTSLQSSNRRKPLMKPSIHFFDLPEEGLLFVNTDVGSDDEDIFELKRAFLMF